MTSGAKKVLVQAPCVGIDLGTHSSSVAIFRNDNTEVIANDMGTHFTPSVIGFSETELLVGDVAVPGKAKDPANTVVECKRLIGKKLGDEDLQEDAKRWSYPLVHNQNKTCVQVQYKKQTAAFNAEQLCSFVLKDLKGTAEALVHSPVKNCVLAAPAYFTDKQRASLSEAASLASLTCVRVISEPVAAAVAYGLDKEDVNTTVAVVSIGSRSSEAVVLSVAGGLITERGGASDHALGGEALDDLLVAWCVKEFKTKYKMDPSESKRSVNRLRNGCESVKKQLSQSPSARVEVESAHEGIDFSAPLSRVRFDDLCSPVLNRIPKLVAEALKAANLEASAIARVLLVGASARVPKVQALVQGAFPGVELSSTIPPEEAVAVGAAVQAHALTNCKLAPSSTATIPVPVTPQAICIGGHGGQIAEVVGKGTALPVERSVCIPLAEGSQSTALIRVFEGEAGPEEAAQLVGELTLSGIEEGPLTVSLAVDVEGSLTLHAKDASGTARHNVTISPAEDGA